MQSKIKPYTKFFNTDIAVEKYSKSVLDVGLWESEKIIFEKYCFFKYVSLYFGYFTTIIGKNAE